MESSILRSSTFNLLSPVLANEEIELVDIEYEQRGNSKMVRLLIDKPDGVSLEDCQYVSRMVRPILDVHEAISGIYQLEVASPGLDRPLVTEADFRRNLGRKVQIAVHGSTDDSPSLEGILKAVNDGKIFLSQSSGKTVQIEISAIAKAQIQLMW